MIGEYQQSLGNNVAQCLLCPHECKLKEGQRSICLSRVNKEGRIHALNYMETVCLALDPIEKKPIRNYHEGSKVLSIGPNGCNMHCPFCQNHSISQEKHSTTTLDIKILIQMIQKFKALGIAYTYTEPFTWFETLRGIMPVIKEEGFKNVVVTNGFVNEKPLRELLPYIDAMNIDLKIFDPVAYQKLGGDLMRVLRTIEICKDHVHLEISYIMSPGNDRPEYVGPVAAYIKEKVGKDTPLHLLRYYPAYRMREAPTSKEVMLQAKEIADGYLSHVYMENV